MGCVGCVGLASLAAFAKLLDDTQANGIKPSSFAKELIKPVFRNQNE